MQTKTSYHIDPITLRANRIARAYGSNRATQIFKIDGDSLQLQAARGELSKQSRVIHFDGYHAESRTGIRASMAALKRFWSTYHYVPTVCKVAVTDIDDVYSNDNH